MATDTSAQPPSGGSSLAALPRTWRQRALLTQEQPARCTGPAVAEGRRNSR